MHNDTITILSILHFFLFKLEQAHTYSPRNDKKKKENEYI